MRVLDHGAGKDILAPESALCVSVLAGLCCADLEDFAGFRFEDGVAAFAESACLARKSEGCAGVAGSLVAVSVGGTGSWKLEGDLPQRRTARPP
jgi:hypothetical protein